MSPGPLLNRRRRLLMVAMPLNFPVPTISRFATDNSQKNSSPAQYVAAFRSCFERFQDCLEYSGSPSASPVMEAAADFVLDFDIIARRAIGSDSPRYRLFQLHFLKNESRQACCTKLKLTEWTFASEVRTIEQTLGKSFLSAGLFPLAPYFADSVPGLEKIAA